MVSVSIKHLICGVLVSSIGLYALEKPEETTRVTTYKGPIIDAIRKMYKEHGMDASHVTFGVSDHERYTKEGNDGKLLINAFYEKNYEGGKHIIVFSPYLSHSLIQTYEAKKHFTHWEKRLLFFPFYDVVNRMIHSPCKEMYNNKYEILSRENFAFNKLSFGDIIESAFFIKKEYQEAPPLKGSREEFLETITDPYPRSYQSYRIIQNALRNKKELFLKEVEQKFIEQGGIEEIDLISHESFSETAAAATPLEPFFLLVIEAYPTYNFFELKNILNYWKNSSGGIYKNPKGRKALGRFYVFRYNGSNTPFPFDYLEALNSDTMQDFFKYETRLFTEGNRGFPALGEIMRSYFTKR